MQSFWWRSSSLIFPSLSSAVAGPLPSPLHLIITIWEESFLWKGGGGSFQIVYDDYFYLWWEIKVPTLQQFPYTGLDFRVDNDLVLPPGEAWGDICIFIFLCYLFFYEF